MSDETSRTIASYNRHASAFAHSLGSASMGQELDTLAGLLPPHALVLDIGAGPGHYTMSLAARGLLAIPLDLSFELLRVAQSHGLEDLVLADMACLPFRRSAFDGIWACASLLHLPKAAMPGALGELRRVVRLGGVFYCSVKLGAGDAWLDLPDTGELYFAYYGEDELDNLLVQSGWAIVGGHINPGTPHRWINRFCRAL